jgi:flagellin-like protein
MKGISTVVATILMLMITIALAGTAYMYINGAFTSKTAVVLSISSADCSASGSTYTATVYVRNDGTLNATGVRVVTFGTAQSSSAIVGPGAGATFTVTNTTPVTAGYVKVTASSASGTPVSGSVFCP